MFKEMVGFAAMTAMAAGKEVGSQVMQAVFEMANNTNTTVGISGGGVPTNNACGTNPTPSDCNGANIGVVAPVAVGSVALVTAAFFYYCTKCQKKATVATDEQAQPINVTTYGSASAA